MVVENLKIGTSRSLRIGLTGSLASGKSTALKTFRKLGFKTLSADDIVAKIYREKGLTKVKLRAKYNNAAKLRKLETWVHPMVGKRIRSFMQRARVPSVVEVPLLFEAGFDKFFDLCIFVYAPRASRLRRVIKRGMDPKLFKLLDSKQWPARKKEARADIILRNTTKKALKKQVKKLALVLKASQK